MNKFLELVDVLKELNEKGISIEKLSAISGLSEKDVKSVVNKGEKLIRRKQEEAIKRLKSLYNQMHSNGNNV